MGKWRFKYARIHPFNICNSSPSKKRREFEFQVEILKEIAKMIYSRRNRESLFESKVFHKVEGELAGFTWRKR